MKEVSLTYYKVEIRQRLIRLLPHLAVIRGSLVDCFAYYIRGARKS